MNVQPTEKLPEVLVIEPDVFGDSRGYFMETFQAERYRANGIGLPFLQDNISKSRGGVLRGLHYQLARPQGKLVYCVSGEIYDVAVDIRLGSPTWGVWAGVLLSEENHRQVYIPPGYAHGFYVVSDEARFVYKCTEYYDPSTEFGVLWNDPALDIDWPENKPILSEKDEKLPKLNDIPKKNFPLFSKPT